MAPLLPLGSGLGPLGGRRGRMGVWSGQTVSLRAPVGLRTVGCRRRRRGHLRIPLLRRPHRSLWAWLTALRWLLALLHHLRWTILAGPHGAVRHPARLSHGLHLLLRQSRRELRVRTRWP